MLGDWVCFLIVLIGVEGAMIRPKLDNKIVGGREVNIDEFPYQVSLQYYNQHMCGASIINQKFILTAAHCTDGLTPRPLTIRYGTSYHAFGGRSMKIKLIHQHPKYNPSIVDYDISILELVEPIKYSGTVQPIFLPYDSQTFSEGSECIVSGWGALSEGGSTPFKLQAVEIPIVSRQRCQSAYKEAPITERMICAGIIDEGRKDACQGDSGGPLVYSGKLVGIVSWGFGCARPKYPGVYTNVAGLRSFIKSITNI